MVPLVSLPDSQHGEESRARCWRLLDCAVSFLALFDSLNSLHGLLLLKNIQLIFLSCLKNKDWSWGECHKHTLSKTSGILAEVRVRQLVSSLQIPSSLSVARLLACLDWTPSLGLSQETWVYLENPGVILQSQPFSCCSSLLLMFTFHPSAQRFFSLWRWMQNTGWKALISYLSVNPYWSKAFLTVSSL